MRQTRARLPIFKHLSKAIVVLFVALLFACGSSATATPVSSTSVEPTPTASSSESPTAMPEATVAPTEAMTAEPAGTIHMGQKETGIFEAHPSMSSSPRIQFTSSSVGEGLITTATDFSASPMLAASWEVSEDFLTWTWKFQEGVQFHKGFGEMTANDVLYSYEQWNAGALHARSGIMGEYFGGIDGDFGGREGASLEIVDDHTMVIDTGLPWVPAQVFEFMRNGGGSSSWVVSQAQSEKIGVEAASKDIQPVLLNAVLQRNSMQQEWAASALRDCLGNLRGKQIAVWGLAFRPETADVSGSAAIVLIRQLLDAGATVAAYDPMAMEAANKVLGEQAGVTFCSHQYDALTDSDALVLMTEWKPFRQPDFNAIGKLLKQPVIIDGRNQYDSAALKQAGFTYRGVGRGNRE